MLCRAKGSVGNTFFMFCVLNHKFAKKWPSKVIFGRTKYMQPFLKKATNLIEGNLYLDFNEISARGYCPICN